MPVDAVRTPSRTTILTRELASLFDGTLHPVSALRAGRLIYGNPSFCAWLGHDRFRGQALWDLAAPSTRERLHAAVMDAASDGLSLELLDGRASEGSLLTLEINGERLRILRLTTLPEINRHKPLLEEEVLSVDRPLWDLLAGARLGFWLVDVRGRTILCNPHAAEALGVALDDMHATTLFDRLPLEGMGLPEGTHHLQVARPDGARVSLEAEFSAFLDENGAPAGALVLMRDVSAQRQIMSEVQRSETRFQVLADTAQSALALVSTRGQVYEINRAAERMFGHSRSAWLNGEVKAIRLYADRKEGLRLLENARRSGRVTGERVNFRRKDGTTFAALLDLTFFLDGEEERFAVSIAEVGGQPRANRPLLDLERVILRINETLQAPLITLSGFLDALKDGGAADQVQRLQRASRSLTRVVHSLGAYTQLSKPQPRVPCALRPLIAQVLEELDDDVKSARAEIRVPDVLPTVAAHADSLRAALRELICNALRFTRPDVAPAVDIDAAVYDAVVTVHVEDNGAGIPTNLRDGLFELFVTTEDHPGCREGLGLAYVRRVAEHHGGRAWLEDSALGGTRVCLAIPA